MSHQISFCEDRNWYEKNFIHRFFFETCIIFRCKSRIYGVGPGQFQIFLIQYRKIFQVYQPSKITRLSVPNIINFKSLDGGLESCQSDRVVQAGRKSERLLHVLRGRQIKPNHTEFNSKFRLQFVNCYYTIGEKMYEKRLQKNTQIFKRLEISMIKADLLTRQNL